MLPANAHLGTAFGSKLHRRAHQIKARPPRSFAGDSSDGPPRLQGLVYRSKGSTSVAHEPLQFPMQLPLLPFPVEEVMVPGSIKVLHLYEARYLALLEEVLTGRQGLGGAGGEGGGGSSGGREASSASSSAGEGSDSGSSRAPPGGKLLCHVCLEQTPGHPRGSAAAALPGALAGSTFVVALATLVRVLEVRAVDVGAVVRIQAEGRVAVQQLAQVVPYMRGTVAPLADAPCAAPRAQLAAQVAELLDVMRDVQNLASRFKSRETAALQAAMYWWEGAALLQGSAAGDLVSERAVRLAFAALQHLPGATEQERRQLVRLRLRAMEVVDTSQRLTGSLGAAREARALLAAKCALRSLRPA